MGPTIDELNKILEIKNNIKQSIINKGVEITDNTKFADYPSKIDNIPDRYNDGYGNGYNDGYSNGYDEGSANGGGDPYYETMWNYITNNNTDYSYLFHNYNGTILDLSNFDTSNVTNMSYMFYNCTGLKSLDVSKFNTSEVTTMNNMFGYCNKLTTLDVSKFNTSNVTNMSNMFYDCRSLTSIDVSNFNTSNVTNIYTMFVNCWELTSLDCSNWDISKCTSTTSIGTAFNSCTKLIDFKAPKNISANMSVANSTALSHDSLMSIINNLATISGKTLTLGATNKAKLSEDEIAIATNKGWTVK